MGSKYSEPEVSRQAEQSSPGSTVAPLDPLVATAPEPSEFRASAQATQPAMSGDDGSAKAKDIAQDEATVPPTLPTTLHNTTLEFLLVDDNAINLKILSSYVKKLNYKYNTASDGREAVDTFQRSPGRYQCVFMDISMPVMDGFEATRRIRTFERETHLAPSAIFALSGLASADAQQEAFASGIDLFLSKPVRLKELTSILAARGLLHSGVLG